MDIGNKLTNIEETESWLSNNAIEFTVSSLITIRLDYQACTR
jgi:hypothetical protein